MNLSSPRLVWGFYTCPTCAKVHTYSRGFTKVECSCGTTIDQFERAGL